MEAIWSSAERGQGRGRQQSGLFTCLLCLLLLCFSALTAFGENPETLPLPTSYVNDFAGVLTPGVQAQLEDLCRQLHNKANADVAVVTIKTLDNGESEQDFTTRLEEHWKLGKKGSDRSLIYLLVLNPHRLRVETGYGLEGILPDAKIGRILDDARPFAATGDYDQAMQTGTQELGGVIAKDAGVTLTQDSVSDPVPRRRAYNGQDRTHMSPLARAIVGIFVVLILWFLIRTGNLGWALALLMNMGGGGGGGYGGGRDDDRGGGGGFGGMGGGASGGGGASRDF